LRKKISRRVRKSIIRHGGIVLNPHWIKEKDWKRKDCGFGVDVKYKDWTISSCGFDELEAYRMAYDSIIDMDEHPEDYIRK